MFHGYDTKQMSIHVDTSLGCCKQVHNNLFDEMSADSEIYIRILYRVLRYPIRYQPYKIGDIKIDIANMTDFADIDGRYWRYRY